MTPAGPLRPARIDTATADALRVPVLRPDVAPGTSMAPAEGPGSLVLGVYAGDELAGTCVVFPEPYPLCPAAPHAWRLRLMAVDPARQGTGVGSVLLGYALDQVVEQGGRLLWCDARVTAVAFYERLGFTCEGDVFTTAATGLPHRRMWRAAPGAEPPTAPTSSTWTGRQSGA